MFLQIIYFKKSPFWVAKKFCDPHIGPPETQYNLFVKKRHITVYNFQRLFIFDWVCDSSFPPQESFVLGYFPGLAKKFVIIFAYLVKVELFFSWSVIYLFELLGAAN
jgi:hypothetical protein